MSEKENLTLKERLINRISEGACPIRVDQICEVVREWLEQKREDMFIDTVSSMDCEMSGIREETFEKLLEELSF